MERISKINVIRSNKDDMSDKEQSTILNDFYNSLTFSYKFESRFPDLVYLYEQVEILLESRVYAHYEDAYRRETKDAIISIMRDNKEYEKELTKMIQEMESREHISFVDYVFIMGAKAAIASKDRTLTEGAFRTNDIREKADFNVNNCRTLVFKSLQAYGVDLGTKKESKTDTNKRIAKTIYEIVCSGTLRKEFDDYCMLKKKEEELSPDMKLLIRRLGIDGISKVSSMSKNRDFIKESLLLM